MPLSPSIAVQQSGFVPNIVVVLDDSSGSDGAITQRRVYVQDAAGNYYVPAGTTTDYTQWAIGDTSISLNILTTDIGANITVQWLDVSNNVLYSFNDVYPLSQYNKQFFIELFQEQSLNPGIVQDANYMTNVAALWANIIGGDNLIEDASDIAGGQNCYDRASNLRINQSLYF